MTTVTIRIPEDVIEDLKKVAPLLGFSGYQPLVRAYIGQGLRTDLERLDADTVSIFIESLKRHGVRSFLPVSEAPRTAPVPALKPVIDCVEDAAVPFL